jgi:hypothetical protein
LVPPEIAATGILLADEHAAEWVLAAGKRLAVPDAITAEALFVRRARLAAVIVAGADTDIRLARADAIAAGSTMVVTSAWISIAVTAVAEACTALCASAAIPIGVAALALRRTTLAKPTRAARPAILTGATNWFGWSVLQGRTALADSWPRSTAITFSTQACAKWTVEAG